MNKRIAVLFLLIGLLGFAKSYAGYATLADSVGLNATAAETISINLDSYRPSVLDGNLQDNSLLAYKCWSSAGNVVVNIVLELSPDNSNWIKSVTLQDSIKTEGWNTDTLPTDVIYYKYGRVRFTGLTGNNADTRIWLKWLFKVR